MKTLIIFLIVGALQLIVAPAYSQNAGSGGYASLTWGLSVPDAANTRPHLLFGFVGGSKLSEFMSLGGYHFQSSNEDGPNNGKFKFSFTGIETRYNIKSGEKNVFISLRAGISKINSVDTGADVIFSPYHIGITSGYNFKVWSKVALGFEGSYFIVDPSNTINGATTVSFKQFNLINFLGTVGFLF